MHFSITKSSFHLNIKEDLDSDYEEKQLVITIVPQLSKCLKFEAVWGVLTGQMI